MVFDEFIELERSDEVGTQGHYIGIRFTQFYHARTKSGAGVFLIGIVDLDQGSVFSESQCHTGTAINFEQFFHGGGHGLAVLEPVDHLVGTWL